MGSIVYFIAIAIVIIVILCDEIMARKIYCSGQSKESEKVVDFKYRRNFWDRINKDMCEVTINLPPDFYAVRIDFISVAMDGPNIIADAADPGSCESDMFIFKGFDNWTPPPRCGNLQGYSFLIDQNANLRTNSFKIIALVSSLYYDWHIRISQVNWTSIPTYDDALVGLSNTNYHPESSIKAANIKDINISEQRRQISHFTPKAVMHGVLVDVTSVPYMVSIRKKQENLPYKLVKNCSDVWDEGEHICGGTIIGNRFVLTAAACFYQVKKFKARNELKLITIVAGDLNVCSTKDEDTDFPSSYHKVKNIVYHYGYDPLLHFHDIAVVVLEKPFKFAPHIKPIQLAEKDDRDSKVDGQIVGLGAWDKNQSDGYFVLKGVFRNFSRQADYYPFGPQVSEVTLEPSSSCSYSVLDEKFKEHNGMKPFKEITKYSHIYESVRCGLTSKRKAKDATRGTAGSPANRDTGGPFVVFDKDAGITKLSGIILKPKKNVWNAVHGENLFSSVAYYRNWIESVVASYTN